MITFYCPGCGVRLQLPAAMAGVTGPCPRCATVIQAPLAAAVVGPAGPTPTPTPTAPAPAQAAAAADATAVNRAEPASITPEPRGLTRQAAAEPDPRTADPGQAPAPWSHKVPAEGRGEERRRSQGHSAGVAGPPPRPRSRHSWFIRVGVPMLFLLACAGIFVATFYLLTPKRSKQGDRPNRPGSGLSSSSGLLPVESGANFPDGAPVSRPEEPKAEPVPPPSPPQAEPKPPVAAGTETGHSPPAAGTGPVPVTPPPAGNEVAPPPGNAAIEALNRFLAAPDLDARMGHLLSDKSPEELAATCLAGKLPEPAIPNIDQQYGYPRERLTEYHFTVEFPEVKPPHPRFVKVIVHQRGEDGRPLVLADPFVDLFDGKLLEFGKAPAEGMRTFHVVAEAVPRCDDPKVPDAAKKLTVRLLANDGLRDEANRPDPSKDLAYAYAGKLSPIGEMLNDASSGFHWGRPQTCVVTLQWNKSDDPQKPYLELVRLDSLSWNR